MSETDQVGNEDDQDDDDDEEEDEEEEDDEKDEEEDENEDGDDDDDSWTDNDKRQLVIPTQSAACSGLCSRQSSSGSQHNLHTRFKIVCHTLRLSSI